MEYSIGKIGRVFLLKFSQDDEFIKGIEGLCVKENVPNAVFYIIGGINNADIVSGPANESFPLEPIMSTIDKKSEILGIGTVFSSDGVAKIHLHAAVSKGDKIKAGCIRGKAKTFLVSEVVMFELNDIDAKRVRDEASGFNLLKIFGARTTG
jgi:predicted DNA-binding protein with PD1-like motif